uniref:Putative DNA polymerase n=1 Tax=viral metagenome TaxID=1070528 RepID=A0A6M3KBM3_9ZZZZ
MLLAYANGYLEKNLQYLSDNVLRMPYTPVTAQWVGRSKKLQEQGNVAIDHVKMGGWCIEHACNTLALWEDLPHVDLYTDIDRPFIDLILEMEHWGLLIDQYALTRVEQQTVDRTSPMETELKDELHVDNLNSNPQVAQALRDQGIIGTRKTKSAKDSVGEESLKPLGLPVTDKLLKWRSLMKTLTTYVPALRKVDNTGRLHTEFGYTRTGRLSSRNPNLQNLTGDSKFEEESDE